jgi:hypothetical protein
VRFAVLSVCVLAAAVPVLAHHSFAAEFDANQPLKVQGRVTRVAWTNPHVWVYFNDAGTDGKAVTWGAEFGAPHQLQNAGWNRELIKPGEEIVVEGFRARTGDARMSARRVTSATTGRVYIDTVAPPAN